MASNTLLVLLGLIVSVLSERESIRVIRDENEALPSQKTVQRVIPVEQHGEGEVPPPFPKNQFLEDANAGRKKTSESSGTKSSESSEVVSTSRSRNDIEEVSADSQVKKDTTGSNVEVTNKTSNETNEVAESVSMNSTQKEAAATNPSNGTEKHSTVDEKPLREAETTVNGGKSTETVMSGGTTEFESKQGEKTNLSQEGETIRESTVATKQEETAVKQEEESKTSGNASEERKEKSINTSEDLKEVKISKEINSEGEKNQMENDEKMMTSGKGEVILREDEAQKEKPQNSEKATTVVEDNSNRSESNGGQKLKPDENTRDVEKQNEETRNEKVESETDKNEEKHNISPTAVRLEYLRVSPNKEIALLSDAGTKSGETRSDSDSSEDSQVVAPPPRRKSGDVLKELVATNNDAASETAETKNIIGESDKDTAAATTEESHMSAVATKADHSESGQVESKITQAGNETETVVDKSHQDVNMQQSSQEGKTDSIETKVEMREEKEISTNTGREDNSTGGNTQDKTNNEVTKGEINNEMKDETSKVTKDESNTEVTKDKTTSNSETDTINNKTSELTTEETSKEVETSNEVTKDITTDEKTKAETNEVSKVTKDETSKEVTKADESSTKEETNEVTKDEKSEETKDKTSKEVTKVDESSKGETTEVTKDEQSKQSTKGESKDVAVETKLPEKTHEHKTEKDVMEKATGSEMEESHGSGDLLGNAEESTHDDTTGEEVRKVVKPNVAIVPPKTAKPAVQQFEVNPTRHITYDDPMPNHRGTEVLVIFAGCCILIYGSGMFLPYLGLTFDAVSRLGQPKGSPLSTGMQIWYVICCIMWIVYRISEALVSGGLLGCSAIGAAVSVVRGGKLLDEEDGKNDTKPSHPHHVVQISPSGNQPVKKQVFAVNKPSASGGLSLGGTPSMLFS